MKTLVVVLASMALLPAPALAEDDVLSKLVPAKVGSSACFKVEYDKAHLAAHPKQASRRVLLSLQYDISAAGNGGRFVRIVIERGAPSEELYMVGGCGFSNQANLDLQGKKLFPAARADAGVSCGMLGGLSSDAEAGDILIQLSADARTAMLYLPDSLAAWRSTDQSGKASSVAFGSDDQVFRLRGVYPEGCSALTALRVR